MKEWESIIVAVITAAAPTLAVLFAHRQSIREAREREAARLRDVAHAKGAMQEVHVLVNNQLSQALEKIEHLKEQLVAAVSAREATTPEAPHVPPHDS